MEGPLCIYRRRIRMGRWFAAICGWYFRFSLSTDQRSGALPRSRLMRGVLVFPAVLLCMVPIAMMF